MNPTILPPAMGKIAGQTDLFRLVMVPSLGEENPEFKPVKLHIKKLTLCRILFVRRGK